MIKLCFLIRQLSEGGAQRQLLTLAKGLDKTQFDITILSLYEGGAFSKEIEMIEGVRHICLNKRGRWDLIAFFFRLMRQLKQISPHILHGYLGTQNCLAIGMKPFSPKMRVVFGVRASYINLGKYDWLARWVYFMECGLSRFANLIIVNSKAGHDYAVSHGFPKAKMAIIPNGIDLDRFQADPQKRSDLRKEWDIDEKEILIGVIGRLDPMKDHPTFLKAASLLLAKRPNNFRFVCVGDGPEPYKNELISLAKELGLSRHILWVDFRSDMDTVYNGLDILVSCSTGEGFSNVIGEAMACNTPCVVTNVGDSAWIVGETGVVVPPENPEALAKGVEQCLECNLTNNSHQVSLRIKNHFSVDKLVEKTKEVLCESMKFENNYRLKLESFSVDYLSKEEKRN